MRKNSSTSGCSALAERYWRMNGVCLVRSSWFMQVLAWSRGTGRTVPLHVAQSFVQVRESRMELSSVPTDAELLALAGEVADEVQRCRLMLVTAESCSGGWIAKTLTDLPGSSAWFDAGVVTYSYEAKEALLGVNPRTLEHDGAVSEGTVLAKVEIERA